MSRNTGQKEIQRLNDIIYGLEADLRVAEEYRQDSIREANDSSDYAERLERTLADVLAKYMADKYSD